MSKKILFISNHAAFFCSHRINLFKESIKKNYDFRLIFGNPASSKMEKNAFKILKQEKVKFKKINFSHNTFNIFDDISALIKIIKFVKIFKPNIVHSASPKGNFIASIVSKIIVVEKLVLSISGLGYLFTESKKNYLNKFKGFLYVQLIKFCIKNKNKRVIVQNKDDLKFIKSSFELNSKEIFLIKGGSGVEKQFFKKFKKRKNKNVIMVSRIVKNKGVREYLQAAKYLKLKYPSWNFFIIGSIDYLSPDSVSQNLLKNYEVKKFVKVINFKPKIIDYLRNSEIFCLPSYREGMPKTVLEALSIGLPVVTTNTIGCRDSIINGYNGLLCKAFDFKDLSRKLEILMINKNLRKKMSSNARNYARKNFPINNITNKIYKIYNS